MINYKSCYSKLFFFSIALIIFTSCRHNTDTPIEYNQKSDSINDESFISHEDLMKDTRYIGTIHNSDNIEYNESMARKKKWCEEATEKARLGTGMERSYFTADGEIIIQHMYVSDLAGGYGKKYRTLAEEAINNDYVDSMAVRILREYKKNGVADTLDNQGFREFQTRLNFEDGTIRYSILVPIY